MIAGLKGFDLAGRTLGVIGGGHIGLRAVTIGNGFGMRVLVFDPHRQPALAKKLKFHYATFDQLLRQSDVLTLHVPYNRQTHHLINKKNIARIKKGAVLINTARGELIDVTLAVWNSPEDWLLLGGGSNVLVADAGIRGLVVRVRGGAVEGLAPDTVRADAGVTLNGLVRWTIAHSLAGLEVWAGTPGSVGGAIYGNAQFQGRLIGDLVRRAGVVAPGAGISPISRARQKNKHRSRAF